MRQIDYELTIYFEKFKDITVCEDPDTGESLLVIPMEKNGIRKKGTSLRAKYLAVKKDANSYNQSHYIQLKLNKKLREFYDLMGEYAPIVGNLRLSAFVYNQNKKGNGRANINDLK